MIETYVIIGLIVAIYFLVSVNLDKGFDKFVHDSSNGQIEYSSWDKIFVPLTLGLAWPYALYMAWKVVKDAR